MDSGEWETSLLTFLPFQFKRKEHEIYEIPPKREIRKHAMCGIKRHSIGIEVRRVQPTSDLREQSVKSVLY